MRGGLEVEHLERCVSIGDEALAADCSLTLAHRLGVAGGDPEGYCDRVPSGLYQHECRFLAAEAHRKRGDARAATDSCSRSGPFEARCAYHLWQHELVQMPASWDLTVSSRRARAICTDWEARLGSRGVPVDGSLPIAILAPEAGFRSLCLTRFYQGRLEPFDRVPIRICAEQQARAECEAAARDVAFRRARDQVQRLAEDCADLPQATEAAAAWWEARHVKVEVEPLLVQGLSEACRAD